MNRAIAYGLMGAASGVLHGLYDQWQQNQQDIRTEKLARARMLEEQQLTRMKAQYDSAVNLQKVQAQLQADMTRDQANNQADADLQAQKDAASAKQKALDRASEERRTATSAGATIGAAKIRAAADAGEPKPKLVAVKDAAGNTSFVVARPGENLPAGSNLTSFSGDMDFSQLPIGMLGNLGAPTPSAGNDSTPSKSSAAAIPPGTSPQNPVDAASLSAAPSPGTWVRRPDGSVRQYLGSGT